MASIVKCIDIAAPVSAVWALLEDVRRLPEFSASTTAVLDAPDRLTTREQSFRQVVRKLGRCFESTWTVLDIEPGRRLTIEGSVGFGVRYRITEELAPVAPNLTRVRLEVDYRLPFGPFGRLAAKAGVERLADHEAEEVLRGLKTLLEGDRRSVPS